MSALAGPEALPLGEFLEVLRARGFSVTVEHHLRLARLLERTGPVLAPAQLRGLLGPIFATDASEQEAFYAAFDSYFAALLSPPPVPLAEEIALPAEPATGTSLRWRRLIGVAVMSMMVLAIYLLVSRRGPWGQIEPLRPPAEVVVDSGQPAPAGNAPVVVGASPVPANQIPPSGATQPFPTSSPAPVGMSSSGRVVDFVRQHRRQLQGAFLAVVLIGFSAGEWRRWRRRDLLIERARRRKPPFTWPVRVSAPKIREFRRQPFYDAARALRRRQAADTEQLDLLASLQATIRGGGRPSLVYRRGSRVPEYLVLIDCVSSRDHQAAFYDQLTSALEAEGVFMARYFFRGDPRICSDERGASSLADLRRLHADHRLLIVGDGSGLLDPLTGDPAAWLPLLAEWRESTLLTPVPSARWGLREETIETFLPVLPATLEALAEVPDLLERGSIEARLRNWHDDAPALPKAGRSVPLDTLRVYLGDPAFEWLCACAIYPELQWNVTLFLAARFPQPGELLNERTLLRLARLSWFREGSLPDELRARLLAALPVERQLVFRRALLELLEANPPPRDSHASAAREIDIAIHRTWIGRHERSFPAAALPVGEQTRDYSELRLHETTAHSGLAFVLPGRLRALVFDQALAPLGARPFVRFLLAVFLAVFLAGMGCLLLERAGRETPPALPSNVPERQTPPPPPPLPSGTNVPGKPGFVISPYGSTGGYIDVRGLPPGTEVKDPYSGKSFLVPPPATPLLEPDARFKETIEQGKLFRERGDMSTALTRFREAAAMDSKSPEAIYEIAITFEKMQLPDKAIEQWRRIYEMGSLAGYYFSAAEARLDQARQLAPTALAEGSIATGKTLGLGRVGAVNQDDGGVSKHLILRIPIQRRAAAKVGNQDVTVQVLFYDLLDNANLVQTNATVSSRWITAPADWLDSTTETLEVDYRLPLPEAGRENRQYFGYLVRLYYQGELQAATGEPDKLIQQYPPEQKLAAKIETSPISKAPDQPDRSATNPPAPTSAPNPGGSSSGVMSPYQTSADFEKYARMLREKALLKLEPHVIIPFSNRPLNRPKYPWKNNIVTAGFNIGAKVKRQFDHTVSAWDPNWTASYGGFDNPDPAARRGFVPAGFIPRQNPFYCALPYNDVTRGNTKPEARTVIPWFQEVFEKEGQSVCRDRWIRIRNGSGKDCYAQWSDCGPFRTDHWQYVFGDERPKPNLKQGSGLEISPAVRDYLGLSGTDVTDWQFVDFKDIPRGPWSMYGDNNTFVQVARGNPTRTIKVDPAPSSSPEPTIILRSR